MADTTKFELTGVESFKMGDCGAAGAMGGSLTQYVGIKEGTMTFDFAPPTISEIFIEESDTAYTTNTTGSAKSFTFELLGLKLSQVPKFLGGTFTAGSGGTKDKYAYPAAAADILQSVQFTSKDSEGHTAIYSFPKCRVSGAMSGTNTKTDTIGLNVTISILQPIDGSGVLLAPMTVEGDTVA